MKECLFFLSKLVLWITSCLCLQWLLLLNIFSQFFVFFDFCSLVRWARISNYWAPHWEMCFSLCVSCLWIPANVNNSSVLDPPNSCCFIKDDHLVMCGQETCQKVAISTICVIFCTYRITSLIDYNHFHHCHCNLALE